MFVLNNVGYGPAIKSPSKRVESAGHDLILIVGMLSLQIIIIIRCLLMILCTVDILTPRSMELFEYSILTMLRLTTARIEANRCTRTVLSGGPCSVCSALPPV